MTQNENATLIAETLYPKEQGYRIVWIFDHSSCHGAFAKDALNAYKMNVKPGGKLRDTIYKGTPQRMVLLVYQKASFKS